MDKEIPADIRTFLENLVYASDEFDRGELIPDALMQELYGQLNEWISRYLLSSIPPDKLGQYNLMNQKGASPEILDVFAANNIPNYSEVLKKAYKDFYDNYLENIHEERSG